MLLTKKLTTFLLLFKSNKVLKKFLIYMKMGIWGKTNKIFVNGQKTYDFSI